MKKRYTLMLSLILGILITSCGCVEEQTKVRVISTGAIVVIDEVETCYKVGDTIQIGLNCNTGWTICNTSKYIDTVYNNAYSCWYEHRIAIIEKIYK